MIVVADSSPLVALVNIDALEILPQLFGTVLIPPAVHAELLDARRPPAVRRLAAQLPGWLDVRTPTRRETWSGLHAGEAEAFSLAVEVGAQLLLMDEKAGRRIATERHFLVAGTVGVLERAAAQNLLDLRAAFERLKQTDFWVTPALLDNQLKVFERQRGRPPGLGLGRLPETGAGRWRNNHAQAGLALLYKLDAAFARPSAEKG